MEEQQIEPTDKGLEYHCIQDKDWRKEHPVLDKYIEDAINLLIFKKISFMDFCDRMNAYIDLAAAATSMSRLSGEALENYTKLYALVIDQYADDENRGEK